MGLQWILIGCFIKFSVQTFQPLILITRMGNFLYHYWGCTSIYRPLSYPLRSLVCCVSFQNNKPKILQVRQRHSLRPQSRSAAACWRGRGIWLYQCKLLWWIQETECLHSYTGNNSYLSYRIIDSFPRIWKWKIIRLKPLLVGSRDRSHRLPN